MDDNRVITICIILVDEDLTCANIVKELLRSCSYEVLRTGGALDVFYALWEKKGGLDHVLTNADNLEPFGTEIFEHIKETLLLPVTSISLDKRKIYSKGQSFSFSAYILNGLSMDGVKKLWQIALRREKDKKVAVHQEENVQRESVSNIAADRNKASSSINNAARANQKSKGVELSEGSKEDHPTSKKPRVVWTIEMHKKFLEAIEIIGYENAVPKKIVEVMNTPGLTRENVASHLQKYRGSMKRTQETVFSPYKPHYQNTLEETSFVERQNYASIESLLLREADKHIPKLHFTPYYTTYIDQKRNMLLSVDKNSSSDNSNVSKFVGYRVTSDGKSVEYGNIEASVQGQSGSACQELDLHSLDGDFGNDLFAHGRVVAAPFENISEQHFCSSPLMPQMLQCFEEFWEQSGNDGVMMKGTGSTSYQFDLDEFDDTIFSQDD